MPRVRRKRKWGRYIAILSIMCGIFYYADAKFSFLRLKEIEIMSDGALFQRIVWDVTEDNYYIIGEGSALPEKLVWDALPKSVLGFWPSLMYGNKSFEKTITNYYPVSVKLRIKGWGKYSVNVTSLDVFMAISWNSKKWWLSPDGRMWLADLPAAAAVDKLSYPDKPILAWDSQLPLPVDTERQAGDIYLSTLPMAKIKKWYDTIDKIEWKKDIYCLIAKKIEGRQVVQILLGSAEHITGEIVVKEDASDWLPLVAALKKQNIYPGTDDKTPQGVSVNATYADMKFTVSERGIM